MGGSSERYTSIGCGIWTWDLWVTIDDPVARLLWLAMYSSPESKQLVPGLWRGTPNAMADLLRMPLDQTYCGLERLVAAKLVEYDTTYRIARLTVLPDTTERAHNDRAIRGWWTRFRTLPDVAIRNVHIHMLWWLVSAMPMSEKMTTAWNETFATVTIPTLTLPMPQVRSVMAQGSLFGSTIGSTSEGRSDSAPTRIEAPILELSRPLVDHGSTAGLPDQDPEQDPEPEPDLLFLDQEQRAAPVEISTSAIESCTTDATSPPQANVPFTVDDLVAVVIATQGGFWSVTDRDRASLQMEIATLPQPDVGLLSDYLRGNRMPTSDAIDLLSRPGALTSAFSRAVRWRTEVDKRREEAAERSAEMARLRAELGV